jgi:DNA-binding LacI/PurR family transcriptional regulator
MSRPNPASSVTLQDIADRAGCSRNTASLAMRDSPRISQATREKIHAIAEQLGYIPNLAARHLIARRSGMIGLYVRALQDAVRTELANSLLRQLHSAEYRPVLGVADDPPEAWSDSPWMKTFRAMRVEALVIVGEESAPTPSWARSLPRVLVANHPDPAVRCDDVALDRTEGARMGIAHLLARGHQTVLVACGVNTPFGDGCIDALKRSGRRAIVVEDVSEGPLLSAALDKVCHHQPAPTAAIFGDSPQAARFLHQLASRSVRCPEDLAVVGYDYFPWADMLRVPLTTIEQPIDDLASEAVRTIRSRLAEPDQPARHRVLPHRLVVRESSGKERATA